MSAEQELSFRSEFIDDYFAECDEHLSAMRRQLLALDGTRASSNGAGSTASVTEELMRSLHSVKGLSAMVGIHEVEQLAHHMEEYLRGITGDGLPFNEDGIDALAAGIEAIEKMVESRKAGSITPASEEMLQQFARLSSPTGDSGNVQPAMLAVRPGETLWDIQFSPNQERAALGINVNSVRERLCALGDILHAAPQIREPGEITFEFLVSSSRGDSEMRALESDGLHCTRRETPAALEGQEKKQELPAATGAFVRVEMSRIDDLMRMVGDLVITRGRLDTVVSDGRLRESPVGEINLILERQLREMRESVTRMRLVPVGQIFERMRFVIRSLEREQRKKVRLEISGGDTEIDKLVVERIFDPLLHLIRNSISHGVESPADRTAAGKNPEAVITLTAKAAADRVHIHIQDDGRGVDRSRVAAKARTLNLLGPDEDLTDDARLLNILCSPGFSTRDKADLTSGRGVGLGVVMTTATQLGGDFRLHSVDGEGARFELELPLTLMIADALIVNSAGQRFAILQGGVNEILRVEGQSVKAMESNELIPHRGGALPIRRLSRLFGQAESSAKSFHVVVCGNKGASAGLAVDRVVGQREIVIRPITDPLLKVRGITGATELGDGRPVLILDVVELTHG